MAKNLNGHGRVTIFPMLHDWETGSRCVLAYTTADNGLTAVLGVVPVEGNVHEPGDLFALAARHGFIGEWKGSHEQRCGCWLACTGSGSRTVRKARTIDTEVGWAVDMARVVDLDSAYYGHLRVHAGRITLDDPGLMEQARALIADELLAV
ncbi:hypothetical protein F7R91_14630 [Streptomyces luteolifulvus]|uniref:Uncharacterized protein n=1 Tax=Streptomyces luteolifulvus TaxID=2615112 RepID=A0A6H9V2Y0_9ACTN|nr:hypothetical protein [Streptomyces luteolifulvus]KAB1146810.1 hypothetical protein F7R91_14630 [Streptomyces luteolifulvus]